MCSERDLLLELSNKSSKIVVLVDNNLYVKCIKMKES